MKISSSGCVVAALASSCSALPTLQENTNATASAWIVGQPVKTTSGTVIGQPAGGVPGVSEYLGIPYAQPPIGGLRWAAPKKYEGTGNLTATSYSPDCPANGWNIQEVLAGLSEQQLEELLESLNLPVAFNLLSAYGGVGNIASEDCLGLNVWTKPQEGEKKKAVMVWIYGGGWQSGSSHNPFYNGKYFANDQDVVLVSINYRTNVFGFPGLPDARSAVQNPGLMDQRLAIEWVRDNIEAFGGDTDRITIFGQSAGGASVDLYSYAYTQDPIVNAMIAQSGTATAFFTKPPADNTEAWYNASIALGCGGSSIGAEASLACMRTKSTAQLLNVTYVSDAIQSVLGNFGPTSDGKIVFSDYDTLARQGDFIQKPFLVGNNDYEAGLFKLFALVGNETFPDIAWCLFNTDIFTCPTAKAARHRHEHGVATWRYRYFGEFYNLRLTDVPNSGAWHGAEIPTLFHTAEESSGAADTPEETSISNYLQKAWADFAKRPYDAFGGAPYYYPEYNPLDLSLVQFADHNVTHPTLAFPISTDSLCGALELIDSLLPGGILGLLTGGGISFSTVVTKIDDFAEQLNNDDLRKLANLLETNSKQMQLTDGKRCPF